MSLLQCNQAYYTIANDPDVQEQKNSPPSGIAASRHTDGRFHKRILVDWTRWTGRGEFEDLNVPGYDFHALKGLKPDALHDPDDQRAAVPDIRFDNGCAPRRLSNITENDG